jgi:hypothetical protein
LLVRFTGEAGVAEDGCAVDEGEMTISGVGVEMTSLLSSDDDNSHTSVMST